MKKYIIFMLLFMIMSSSGFAQAYTNATFHNDKSRVKKLCNKNAYTEPLLYGVGDVIETGETHSAWYEFTIATAGTLDFVIQPINPDDDIDFILYFHDDQYGSGSHRQREVYDGPYRRGNTTTRFNSINNALTGLSSTGQAGNFASNNGNANGFLKSANVSGKYYLCVNNYFNTSGFTITWGGTCTFASCTQNKPLKGKELFVGEIFPNPAHSQISIDVEHSEAQTTALRLIDLEGRVIYRREEKVENGIHRYQVEIADLAKGMYILEISDRTKNIIARRFLKLDN
jgi:hypothetical protein